MNVTTHHNKTSQLISIAIRDDKDVVQESLHLPEDLLFLLINKLVMINHDMMLEEQKKRTD